MKRVVAALAACLALAAAVPARSEILIGQTAGITGVAAAGVKETTDGAKLYLDAVNAKGGVNGQTIELVSMDDKFDPKLAAQNARTLIVEKNVLALFLTRGTPHNQAILPLLDEFKLPLIAPSTGAMALHKPVHPWVFNVRATYQREAQRAVQHLSLIGLEQIGVIHVADSFGADLLEGAQRGFAAVGKKPAFVESFNREKPDFAAIATKAAASPAQAVLLIGTGGAAVDGVKALRAAGSRAQIVTFSNNASAGFVKALGEHARGIIVAQVFPYERSLAAPIVREAHDLAVAAGRDGVTPAMLEGFAAAKVLVAALRKAGPSPTRAKLQQALDGLSKLDIGGLEVNFSPQDHTGLEFVDLSIIGPDGRFKR